MYAKICKASVKQFGNATFKQKSLCNGEWCLKLVVPGVKNVLARLVLDRQKGKLWDGR